MAATEKKTGGYQDIREYLDALEENGLLKHVTAPVDLKHEIGAIASRQLERGGPAVMFENITSAQQENGSWKSTAIGEVYPTALYLIVLQLDKGHLPYYQR